MGILTGRRNHARCNRVTENSSKVIYKSANDYGLVSQSARWCLSHYGVASRSDSDHVAERRYNQENSNGQLNALPRAKSETANRYKAQEHESQATHVNSWPAEVREQKPADDTADDVARRKGYIDIKCLDFCEACSFEEDNRVAKDGISAEDLGRPDNTVLSRGNSSQ